MKVVVGVVLAVFLFVLGSSEVLADPPGWSNDTRLTFDPALSMDPRVATDYNGNAHAVWSDFRGGFSQIYYTKIDGFSGNIVVGERRIVDAESTDASLVTDSVGDVRVVYRRYQNNWQIFHTQLDNNGTVGQTRQVTSFDNYHSIMPVITSDLRNTFHVAFQSGPDGTTRAVHYLGLNNDGTVRIGPVRVSLFLNVPEHISIGTDTLNEIHLAWHDPREGDPEVHYSKMSYGGVVLVNDLRVSALGGASQNPSLAVDRNNRVHMVWEDYRDGDFEIYYTQLSNNGTTLVDDLRLTHSIGGSRRPSLAIGRDGTIYVVWSDSRDGNAEIYYTQLSNNGTTLVDDLRLTTSTSDSHSPTLAISNDRTRIHVVWVDERDGNPELYYKYRLINLLPELQPISARQTNENQSLTIQLNASDPENDTLTFSTNAASILPSLFLFNTTSGLFIWTPTFRDAGVYRVTFSVSDGINTDSETINITVNDVNLAPELQPIPLQSLTESQSLTVRLNATDFDSDPLTFSTDAGTILPSNFTFDGQTGAFRWQTTYTDYGTYNVTFAVSDGQLEDREIATINVRDAQLSNLLAVGAPVLGNTVRLILSDRTAANQPYVLVLSTEAEPPILLPDGRAIGLQPNMVFATSLFVPTLVGLRDSVGIFNTLGNALATWTVPNVQELINQNVYLAFVSLDTVQPGTRSIISISPVVAMTIVNMTQP